MIYNRYGYGLMGLVMLESLIPADAAGHSGIGRWLEGFSTGAGCGLALYLKATYFIFGCFLLLIPIFWWRRTWSRWIGIVLGASFISLCILWYIRFDVTAMIADLRMAAGARAAAMDKGYFVWSIFTHGTELFAVALWGFVAALVLGRQGQWRGWRLPVAAVLMYLTDLCIMMGNAQGHSDCGFLRRADTRPDHQ